MGVSQEMSNHNFSVVHLNLDCDPAGVSWLLHKELLKSGIESHHLLGSSYAHLGVAGGYGLSILDKKAEAEEILSKADIVHINIGLLDSFATGLDYPSLLKGKCLILHNHGGDPCLDPEKQLSELNGISDNVKHIVCSPLTKYVAKDSIWLPNIIPINEPIYKPIVRNYAIPLMVCHKVFSSVNTRKGSDLLDYVINGYLSRNGYLISLQIFNDLPIKDCLEQSAHCHICVDNLTQGFIGMCGWESLSMGQVVIARLDPIVEAAYNSMSGNKDQNPILNVSGMDEMSMVLRELCADKGRLMQLAKYSRWWMQKYYSPAGIVAKYIDMYEDALLGI